MEQYRDKIHITYAGATANCSFNIRPTPDFVKEIKEAIANGKEYFIFNNVSETVFTRYLTKIHLIANMFPEIDSRRFIFAVGATSADIMYKDYVAQNNIQRPISIICCHTFEHFAKTYLHKPLLDAVGDYQITVKPKKFVCFNKVHRYHRIALTAKLLDLGLVDQSYYSFEGGYPEWINQLYNCERSIKTTILANEERFPIRLNISSARLNPVDLSINDIDYHANSYFSVVTETIFYNKVNPRDTLIMHYENTIFISEKTYKAIAFKHPFIVLAAPGMLKELQRRGYQTFAPYIDESYDSIQDDDARLAAVVNEISRLCAFTDQEWIDWQTAIKPIVEHNQRVMYESWDYNSTTDIDKIFQ